METGLQKLNHQQKAVQWGERIASCRSSGLTVRQWCSENGISAGSYYKWQRRLYQMTAGDGTNNGLKRPVARTFEATVTLE